MWVRDVHRSRTKSPGRSFIEFTARSWSIQPARWIGPVAREWRAAARSSLVSDERQK